MKYRIVIFDLDGTLIDSIRGILYSINSVLRSGGFPVLDVETCIQYVGHGRQELVRRALPEQNRDPETLRRCCDAMAAEYEKHYNREMRVYDGIKELLEQLAEKNILLAINTSKTEALARRIAEEYLPEFRFAAIAGRDTMEAGKPDPSGVFHILKQTGCTQEQCLYVGDSEVDIETAKNAGVDSVSVSWGFRTARQLNKAGAEKIVGHPSGIIERLGYQREKSD